MDINMKSETAHLLQTIGYFWMKKQALKDIMWLLPKHIENNIVKYGNIMTSASSPW